MLFRNKQVFFGYNFHTLNDFGSTAILDLWGLEVAMPSRSFDRSLERTVVFFFLQMSLWNFHLKPPKNERKSILFFLTYFFWWSFFPQTVCFMFFLTVPVSLSNPCRLSGAACDPGSPGGEVAAVDPRLPGGLRTESLWVAPGMKKNGSSKELKKVTKGDVDEMLHDVSHIV